ncbi:MAG: rhamnulose-1-phosphate aldolase [Bacteroidales bacterium]|nr:rhamnulose-1-phosphate aldolase [Bacteroidales bacterium]
MKKDFNSVVRMMAEAAGYLWEKGWAERNGGNISCNVSQFKEFFEGISPLSVELDGGVDVPALAGALLLVTGTGTRMRDVASDPMANMAVIRICDDGRHYVIVAERPVRPTSELPSHLAIHNYFLQSGSSCRAVIHTHPTELVAMSHHAPFLEKDVLGTLLRSMIPETYIFCPKGVGIVPYVLPGSNKLAENTLEQLHSHDVVIWEKHGVLAVGEDPVEAFDKIDILNKSAQIYMSAQAMGFTPAGLTQDQMEELKKNFIPFE